MKPENKILLFRIGIMIYYLELVFTFTRDWNGFLNTSILYFIPLLVTILFCLWANRIFTPYDTIPIYETLEKTKGQWDS